MSTSCPCASVSVIFLSLLLLITRWIFSAFNQQIWVPCGFAVFYGQSMLSCTVAAFLTFPSASRAGGHWANTDVPLCFLLRVLIIAVVKGDRKDPGQRRLTEYLKVSDSSWRGWKLADVCISELRCSDQLLTLLMMGNKNKQSKNNACFLKHTLITLKWECVSFGWDFNEFRAK